jgi:hypothetical protein
VLDKLTVFPFRIRAGYYIRPYFSVDLLGGYVIAEKLRLEDENGDSTDEDDYSPVLFGVLTIYGRF